MANIRRRNTKWQAQSRTAGACAIVQNLKKMRTSGSGPCQGNEAVECDSIDLAVVQSDYTGFGLRKINAYLQSNDGWFSFMGSCAHLTQGQPDLVGSVV